MNGLSDTRTALIEEEGTALQRVSSTVVGVGFVTFFLAWAILFELANPDETVLGVALYDVLGAAMTALGLAVVGIGIASRVDAVETTPSDTAGLLSGSLFALVGLVATGLFVSQTLGVSGPFGLGWFVPAVIGGLIVGAATVLPREDVGSTLPAGAFGAAAGALVLADVIGPDWSWNPTGFAATLSADIAVPVMAMVVALLAVWPAAKAYEGFGSRGRQTGAYLLIGLNALGMLAVLFLLVFFIVSRGLPGLMDGFQLWPFEWPFVLNGAGLRADPKGIFPAVVGTVWLVVGAVLVAVPTGVGAAIFLTEYAEQGKFTRVVEVATNGLWSTPSVVYGLFGYAFLVPRFGNSLSLVAGQLVLGFMLLPLVVITSREALKSVPDDYRDASAALGVNKWKTIRSVVLPAAMPGVITGIILGVGRIAGETAPILLVTSASTNPTPMRAPSVLESFRFISTPPYVVNDALMQPATALPYQLYAIITTGVVGDINPWSTALVLLIVVLGFYAIGIISRWYFRSKLNH